MYLITLKLRYIVHYIIDESKIEMYRAIFYSAFTNYNK
jgi:hypothetical protein